MILRPFASMLPLALSASLLASCNSSQDSHNAQPTPTTPVGSPAANPDTGTLSTEQAAELSDLPSTVLMGVKPGEDASAADLRIPGTNVTGASDANAALQAYQSGLSVKVDGTSNELDRASSAASWAPYAGTSDFANYAPKVYSKVRQGVSYSYNHVGVVNVAGMLLHIFQRPGYNTVANNGLVGGFNPGKGYGYGGGPNIGRGTGNDYDSQLAGYFKTYGVYALSDSEFQSHSKEKVALGARLFYDTKLSTNGGVSCASCHLASQGTANVFSLPPTGFVLDGSKKGRLGSSDMLGRNTPGLYNLGHNSYSSMFWDSRVRASDKGFITPAGDKTPLGLESALAAQALFPLATGSEMAGCAAGALVTNQSSDPNLVWTELMSRLLADNDYKSQFAAAYPDQSGSFGIEHLANAIAAFEAVTWRADQSPFDQYVRGDLNALSPEQKRGATYFYGKGQCGGCHSGPLQTDHGHHGVAVVQIGPGTGVGSHGWEDFGYGKESGNGGDNYKFRTPSLRNTAMTGPWGHDGAYTSLRAFVDHYKNPIAAFDHWNPKQIILPAGASITQDTLGAWYDLGARSAIKAANEANKVDLKPDEVDAIVLFLQALTDAKVAQNTQAIFKN
ncbi:MAG: hypothetical protein NTZ90_02150 [Proteobacteria bacterium]|nr:hypothetical protein [Pseudomonadota bacterium]